MVKKLFRRYLSYTLLFVSSILYGIYTGVQKQGLSFISNPFEFALFTMIYSSIFLLPMSLSSLKKGEYKISKKLVGILILLSMLTQFIALSLKLFALTNTTATSAGLIASFSSVVLVIYSALILREKIPKGFMSVLMLMTIGLVLFRSSLSAGIAFGRGELLMLIFINVTSISNVLVKSISKKYPPIVLSFGRMLFSIPALYIASILSGSFDIKNIFSIWPLIAGLLFASRNLMQYEAIKLTNLSNVAIVNIVAPIATFLYGFVLLGERLSSIQAVGASVVLFGTYLMVLIKKKNKIFLQA